MSIGILKKFRETAFLRCYPKQFFSEIKKSAKAGTAPVFVSDLAFSAVCQQRVPFTYFSDFEKNGTGDRFLIVVCSMSDFPAFMVRLICF
ncbi:hypothetical protein [Enterococcus gallinarum]|uniref:hypothetical protein n=1 Tax=Enterococcus gallinarum TaxID=1353 RepID=UPI000A69EB7F|nr:hypothetical protein [Enterococcus gallinarum]